MTERIRDSEGTGVVDDHHHVVKFFVTDEDLVGELAAFARVGITEGEPFLLIATSEHRAALESLLQEEGVDLAIAAAEGRYVAVDAGETLASFLVDGRPSRDRFRSVVGRFMVELEGWNQPLDPAREAPALSRRATRPRAFGEMVSLLWDAGKVVEALELEELWDELVASGHLSLCCGYPVARFDPRSQLSGAAAVCDAHSRAIPPRSYDVEHPCSTRDDEAAWRLFFPTPSSLSAVRQFVRSSLERLDDGFVEGACLVATELATNALYHVKSPYAVGLHEAGGTVLVSVRDVSAQPPVKRHLATTAARGRGLPIVEQMSVEWGVEPIDDGKVVWARLEA